LRAASSPNDDSSARLALMFRVKDDDAAIALANDSDFGLGGSVWTKDVTRGERVASRVETGMMFVNNIDWSDAELPFGGIKNSGTGASWATWASRSSSTRSWCGSRRWRLPPDAESAQHS
jgi:acyl-CoA reductase-like NAD-dependent aldehyde dehydrogenase